MAGGEFTITTSQGDIYTGDTTPPPNNFILQDAAHAGTDWTIETKIPRATIIGEYAQGGLIAYVDGNNYVKFDVDLRRQQHADQPHRAALGGRRARSRTRRRTSRSREANDDGPFYLRLTKAGTNYSGEYSYDGATWTAFPGGSVPNPMQAPDFGLFAFSPQPDGRRRHRDVRLLLARRPGPAERVRVRRRPAATSSTRRRSTTRSGTRSSARTRQSTRSTGGKLAITTVAGDIYTNGDPLPTRNFILQTADHAGADWEIETSVDVTQITQGGYEQGGLMAYKDDDNYVKFDPVSDPGNTDVNRIELRSEVAGAIGANPRRHQHPGRHDERLAADDQDRHELLG